MTHPRLKLSLVTLAALSTLAGCVVPARTVYVQPGQTVVVEPARTVVVEPIRPAYVRVY